MNIRIRLLSLFLTISTLSGCGMAGLPFTGQVTDAETGEPIEGVIVVALWRGDVNPIIDSSQVCYHVETAVSDENGSCRIPGWVGGKFGVMASYAIVEAYKKGYERTAVNSRYSKDEIKMAVFDGGPAERIKHIRSFKVSCYSAGNSERNTLLLREALHKEAKDLARTIDDEKAVEWLRTSIEEITYGFEEAEKRHFERIGAGK